MKCQFALSPITILQAGNSGSPVLNSSGQLIGIAFDGNWEGMAGDIDYDP